MSELKKLIAAMKELDRRNKFDVYMDMCMEMCLESTDPSKEKVSNRMVSLHDNLNNPDCWPFSHGGDTLGDTNPNK